MILGDDGARGMFFIWRVFIFFFKSNSEVEYDEIVLVPRQSYDVGARGDHFYAA